MFIYRLQNAGVNFKLNDLRIAEWLWLEELKQAIVEHQKEKDKIKNGKKRNKY